MKDRMTLGHEADVAETAALTLADENAERRMFDELDRETDRKAEGGRIGAALRRLNASDRAFARAVLNGRTWRNSGMTKQGFNRRLKKICDFLSAR